MRGRDCHKPAGLIRPLRGGKRSWWEGGIRVPTTARPGKIKAGSESDHPSAFWDFLPTACEVAGIEVPDGIDGLSYLPELLGRPEKQERHEYLYWPGAVRVGNWKLHRYGKNDFKLFDLENDLGEENDLALKMPEQVTRLGRFFEKARR